MIPFETRVAIFRQFISNDRKRLGIERHIYNRSKRHRAVVRRAHVSEDSYAHLNGLGAALKGTIEIVFIDEHGMEESGIDGGGLFKELLTSSVSSLSLSTYVLTRRCRLSKEAFDTDRGLWLATKEQELYPNPHSYARESTQLSWYTFIGRILGKALYEGILIDVRFAGFFLAKWLGRQSYRGLLPSIDKREGTEDWAVVDDLASLDPELYNGLMFLKNYTGDVEADLSLNFSITDDGMYPLPSPPSAAVTDGVRRLWRLSNHRPDRRRLRHPRDEREPDPVHLPHLALPPQLADRETVRRLLLWLVRNHPRAILAHVQPG